MTSFKEQLLKMQQEKLIQKMKESNIKAGKPEEQIAYEKEQEAKKKEK